MNYYSPSYKRAKGVKTHKILPSVIYCVHEFEKEEYINLGYNVEVLPNKLKGNISRVRNYILENFVKEEGIIIDDDIEDILIWQNIDGRAEQIKIEGLDEWIEKGFIMCKDLGAHLWGVNILGDKGSYREYTPFSTTSTISASFMGFINNKLKFDEKLPLKDDYDFCINNLNEYRKILRFNNCSLVKKDHGNVGGCADYRNIARETEQINLLAKKWGARIVKFDKVKSEKKKIIDINPIVKVPIKGV